MKVMKTELGSNLALKAGESAEVRIAEDRVLTVAVTDDVTILYIQQDPSVPAVPAAAEAQAVPLDAWRGISIAEILKTIHDSGTYAIIKGGDNAFLHFVSPGVTDETLGYQVRAVHATETDA